jgi:uncharacterized membrane protein YhhN
MIFTITCALATLALIYAEYTGKDRLRTSSKFVASSSFIAVGLCCFHGGAYGTWILIGLVFGAIGDIALLGRSNRAFLAGLVAFLIGHIAYVVAAAAVAPLATWPQLAAIVPVIAAGVALRGWLWPKLGALKVPVIFYVLVITAMVVGSFATWRTGHCRYFTIGAVIFFLSDLCVARDKFIAPGFANKLVGLPLYFAGQLLIAHSI